MREIKGLKVTGIPKKVVRESGGGAVYRELVHALELQAKPKRRAKDHPQ